MICKCRTSIYKTKEMDFSYGGWYEYETRKRDGNYILIDDKGRRHFFIKSLFERDFSLQ